MPASPRAIHALIFDVFGTVVDWRGSIIRECRVLGRRKKLAVDWAAFADAWRAGYVVKPVERNSLVATIKAQIAGRSKPKTRGK